LQNQMSPGSDPRSHPHAGSDLGERQAAGQERQEEQRFVIHAVVALHSVHLHSSRLNKHARVAMARQHQCGQDQAMLQKSPLQLQIIVSANQQASLRAAFRSTNNTQPLSPTTMTWYFLHATRCTHEWHSADLPGGTR
jgi:hypothetical protein